MFIFGYAGLFSASQFLIACKTLFRGFLRLFEQLFRDGRRRLFEGRVARFAEDERTQTKDVGIVGKASAPGGELAFAYGRRYAAVEVCDKAHAHARSAEEYAQIALLGEKPL